MTILIIAVVGVILLVMVGVEIESLLWWVTALAFVLLGLMTLFFVAMAVILAMSKKTKAKFCGIKGINKAENAVYSVNGSEYKNLFPAEKIRREKIYFDGEHTVYLWSFVGKSFALDKHTVAIIVTGLVLSPASLVTLWLL